MHGGQLRWGIYVVSCVREVLVAVDMRMRGRTKLKRRWFKRRIIVSESFRNFAEPSKGIPDRSFRYTIFYMCSRASNAISDPFGPQHVISGRKSRIR